MAKRKTSKANKQKSNKLGIYQLTFILCYSNQLKIKIIRL